LLARSDGYSGGNWTSHNYYFADGNGNVTYMVNSSQTGAAAYRYDPFGNTISSSGSLAGPNVYRFSSKEIHPSSGLYYFGYRFYDASTQRWISRDPLEEYADPDPDRDPNLYRITLNDPENEIDSLGLDYWPVGAPLPGGLGQPSYDPGVWYCSGNRVPGVTGPPLPPPIPVIGPIKPPKNTPPTGTKPPTNLPPAGTKPPINQPPPKPPTNSAPAK
jgi:RHS repeat-associated protein